MRIVTPPEHVVKAQPGTRVKRYGPPPHTTGVGSADMLVGVTEHGPVLYGYAVPEPEEVAALLRGGVIEVAMYGDHLHPWSVGVWPAANPDGASRDGAENAAASAAATAATTAEWTTGEQLAEWAARLGFREGSRWAVDGGFVAAACAVLDALGWAEPSQLGPAAVNALHALAGMVGWSGSFPSGDADPVPPYVLPLVRSLTTGEPLDFGGVPVPGSVQALLDEAFGPSWSPSGRVETRWVVRWKDGTESGGWRDEDDARGAVARGMCFNDDPDNPAVAAAQQWRYGPTEWIDGAPPAPSDAISQADARWAVDLARRATDGFGGVVAAVERLHELLDEFPDAVPTMRVRMLFATMEGHRPLTDVWTAEEIRRAREAFGETPPPAQAEGVLDPEAVADARRKPPSGFLRRTHTTTHVYGEAPCGHRVAVPNEAYERPVDEAIPHESGVTSRGDFTMCQRRFVVEVVDGEAVFTEHAGRWAWAAAAGSSVATDCPEDCPACAKLGGSR